MSGYNVKFSLFENGQIECVHYGHGVRTPLDEEQAYLKDVKSKRDSLYADFIENQSSTFVANPFTGENQKFITMDMIAYQERKALHSACGSLNRTRNKLYQLTRQVTWEYFITLTYRPDVVDRYDFTVCMDKARAWVNNMHKRCANNLKYVLVPEQHKDGAWHVHGLLADTGSMSFVDSGKSKKGLTIYNMADWSFGWSTATKVKDTHKVSFYVTKYITKDLCAVIKNKRRFYASMNIPKVNSFTYLIEPCEVDSFIQTVADSLGADFEYGKDIGGYLDVEYKYFKVNKEKEKKE